MRSCLATSLLIFILVVVVLYNGSFVADKLLYQPASNTEGYEAPRDEPLSAAPLTGPEWQALREEIDRQR